MNSKIKAAVLGCTGYAGLELVYILTKHPNVTINFLGSQNHAGNFINKYDNRFGGTSLPKLNLLEKINFSELDVAFFALPHNISQYIIKNNIGKSIFIDLSADFRLRDPKIYKENYNIEHQSPSLLKEFVYGLPEINHINIKNSKNIAVPGCYPTSILLPLIPLLKEDLILTNNIIIDSKSGYSGAGKKFNLNNIRQKNDLNFYNYNTNNHRHICEIYQELNKFSVSNVKFSFNPHVLPVFRGLMSTIYCDLKKGTKKYEIINALKKEYSDKVFIDILNHNAKADFFSVCNTNKCLIKLFEHSSDDKIIIVSLIDNLLKGASGQAIQCMNLIFGLEDCIGLV